MSILRDTALNDASGGVYKFFNTIDAKQPIKVDEASVRLLGRAVLPLRHLGQNAQKLSRQTLVKADMPA